MDHVPAFGLNRWDWTSVEAFAADVQRAEELGYQYAFTPWGPLAMRDPYVSFAAATARTTSIRMGLLLDNPVLHHPAVSASSAATLDEISGGRAILVYGVGDTAVRHLGLRPARMVELEAATVLARRLLAGEDVEVGAVRPARLRHARPVPVWIAAGGPKTMELAGRVADGVFLRVGRHPENLRVALERVHRGAEEAGRNPEEVGIGLIFHTVMSDDPDQIAAIARSMAAGYYEYTSALFEIPGIAWNGPPPEQLREHVYPDFHHAADLVRAGGFVDFLDDAAAQSFSLFGSDTEIADQLRRAVSAVGRVDIIVPHPVPFPDPREPVPRALPDHLAGADFKAWFANQVLPKL